MNKVLTGLLLLSLKSFSQEVAPFEQQATPIQGISIKDKEGIELLQDKVGWNEGSIMLLNGSEIKGLVKYNDRNGILSYYDGENTKPFTAKNVVAFEFFDEDIQRQRLFYSIEQEDAETQIQKHQIFEVIRDYQTFAILLRTDPIEMKQKNSIYSNGISSYTAPSGVNVTQIETVYILDEAGKVRPYFQLTVMEDGRKSLFTNEDVKKKNKMIDEELISKYITEPKYQELVDYAHQHKLRFNVKEDFYKILEYYDSIK